MDIEARLKELGIELPDSPAPLGSYVPCVRTGNLLFLSGVLPIRNGELIHKGRVDRDVSVEEARDAARLVLVNALAAVRSFLGDLGRISRCVKINGFVSSSEGFVRHPEVINAASDLLVEIMGERGRHARAAVGVFNLPLDAPLEMDFVFEIED